MNVFDLAVLGVLALFAAIGVFRGFVRSAFFLANWVVAGAAAWLLSAPVAAALEKSLTQPVVRMLVAFLLLFVVVFVAGIALSRTLHKMVEATPVLKGSNRLLGGLVGVAIGVVVVVFVFMMAGLTTLPNNGWWRHSLLAPYFESLAIFARDLLPTDIARHIRYS